jgi:hypothetical protein
MRGGEISLLPLCGEYYTMWRLWAKALGEKNGKNNIEADRVAIIRTVIILSYILTNMFIIAGVIRHW